MVKLNDLMKDFDIDLKATKVDSSSAVDVVRDKMCAKIDKHINRYVRGNVEYKPNKSGKTVKVKVDRLSASSDKAGYVAIFMKYGNDVIKVDGQAYIPIPMEKEEEFWGVLKEAIKKGDFDADLTEASRKSSIQLRGGRKKKNS